MDLFSSAFDATAVDFLEKMGVPAHKVASFELVDIPLIQKMARTGKPLIMSTGMATVEEIDEACASAREAGATQIALLKCTSAYPAPAEEMNLRTIPEMARRFGVPVGLVRPHDGNRGTGGRGCAGRLHHREASDACRGRLRGRTARSRWSRRNSKPWWRRCAPRRRLWEKCISA